VHNFGRASTAALPGSQLGQTSAQLVAKKEAKQKKKKLCTAQAAGEKPKTKRKKEAEGGEKNDNRIGYFS